MKHKNFTTDEFKKYCSDSEIGWLLGSIIIVLISLCGFATIIYSIRNGKGNWADGLFGGIELLTVALSFNFTSKIFRSMKKTGSPFSYDIADKIKGLSMTIEIGGFVCFILSVIIKAAGYKELVADISCIEPSTFFILTLAFSVFFDSMAKTYDYGAELQQQSDETL